MARLKRENADYFSHDADMRNDPRVKALRNKFGLYGYAVWCMLLEVLTDSDFFKRDIDSLEMELLSADFGIESDDFQSMLDYMVQIKLLQKSNNNEFLSQKLIDRLQSVTEKRQRARERSQSVTENTQSKVKKSKVKKSKVFKAPTIKDIDEYRKSKGYLVDAKSFFDYYDASGWKNKDGTPVKSWKQTFVTWENKDKKTRPVEPEPPEMDEEEFERIERNAELDRIEMEKRNAANRTSNENTVDANTTDEDILRDIMDA